MPWIFSNWVFPPINKPLNLAWTEIVLHHEASNLYSRNGLLSIGD